MFSVILASVLALDQFFSAPTLAGAHTGALVIDAQSGNVLYARNASDAFVPASTMKLIVGSAALDILGDAFDLTTKLSTDGKTLYLVGGGDVLLTDADVTAASEAILLGEITEFGDFTGDDTRYSGSRYPDGWQVDDLPYDYAAPPNALSFAENALHLSVAASAQGVKPDLTITPRDLDDLIDNRAQTGAPTSEDSTDLAYDWKEKKIALIGSIPAGTRQASELDAAIVDPATRTTDVFYQTLMKNGVHFGEPPTVGPAPGDARVLWQHHSKPLPHLLGAMWKPSDNLLAETLLEEIGVASSGTDDTRARGITREARWLHGIGIDPKTVTIADGSGLSSYDRVTPHALVTILNHDWFSSHRQTMLDDLPVAGVSGTLEHVFTDPPLAGNVFAKTGTSNHTRTLAGYVRTSTGWRIFALMINDWMDSGPGSADRLRAVQAAFLRAIASGKAPAALQ